MMIAQAITVQQTHNRSAYLIVVRFDHVALLDGGGSDQVLAAQDSEGGLFDRFFAECQPQHFLVNRHSRYSHQFEKSTRLIGETLQVRLERLFE
jgi:hypothetical protein